MKKLFVSLPMRGLSEREIKKRMNYLKSLVEVELGEEVILIDTFIEDEPDSEEINDVGLYYLGKSIEEMAYADIVIFANGWMNARGCEVEYKAAVVYGVKILYEDSLFYRKLVELCDKCDKHEELLSRIEYTIDNEEE